MDRHLFWGAVLTPSAADALMLRLQLHPDLRVSYQDSQAMSLLEILHRHAILDKIDAAKAALSRS